MKKVDIRFIKEQDKKRLAEQENVMQKLSQRIPARIASKFPNVEVRIRFSSSSGIEVSGFRGEEKEAFLAFLEELWDDPFLLDD